MPRCAKPELLTEEQMLVHSLKKPHTFAHILVAQGSYVNVRENI